MTILFQMVLNVSNIAPRATFTHTDRLQPNYSGFSGFKLYRGVETEVAGNKEIAV